MDLKKIKEHAQVIGADGKDVGIVDRIDGDHIKLTRHSGPSGQHCLVPLSLVADVDGEKVRLSVDAAIALDFSEEDGAPSAA